MAEIRDVAMLDLTTMRSPEELSGISEIRDVALILVPESLMGTLTAIPMRGVADVLPIPDGGRTSVRTGTTVMAGDGLADPGAENVVLVVTGCLIFSSPVEKITYNKVFVTGLVLAPRGSEAVLNAGLTEVTGSVQYFDYADGQRIKTMGGQAKISGEALANSYGGGDDVLVLAGNAVVTGRPTEIGYQQIIVGGNIVAPRESEPILWPVLSVTGNAGWYSGNPRFITGRETLGRGFFELLDEPISLVILGRLRLDRDIPPELLREKVSELVLLGRIVAPRDLRPVVQLLTTENLGRMRAAEDAGEDE